MPGENMRAEILEEPIAVANSVDEPEKAAQAADFLGLSSGRIILSGNGTSFHACLVAAYGFFKLMGIYPLAVHASEFPEWDSEGARGAGFVVVSQSGESSDAVRAAKVARKNYRVLAITNHEHSQLAQEAQMVLITRAGDEKAVTATKTFTTQLAVFYLLIAQAEKEKGKPIVEWLRTSPEKIKTVLSLDKEIRELAHSMKDEEKFFVLGSGASYPIALETSLKLKEAAGVFAEGFPTREFLHGPMQLMDKDTPIIAYGIDPDVQKKALEYKVPVIDMLSLGLPESPEPLSPLLESTVAQLFAYHLALARGLDPDRPSKLGKVVR
ncbi:MAG: SIS domain-containing protein [Thermoprotei archaeon]